MTGTPSMHLRGTLRLVALLVLVVAACPFVGCSIGYRFIVVNASQGEVTVAYSLRSQRSQLDGQPPRFEIEPLLELGIGELGDSKARWRPVAADRVSFDPERGTVTVRLAGSTALQVAEITNYSGNEFKRDDFPLETLALTGTRGEVRLLGEQVRHHFVSTGDSYYRLIYG